ncbi:MAG: PrgI family protein [Clostridia bacterium]|nr:PrgI family protein [Clostridia bacterium]
MRNFHIPFDMHTEDKIIGGYISLRQFVWLLAGSFVAIWLLGINKGYIRAEGGVKVFSLALRILISLVFVGLGIYLAFVHVDEMEADKYWIKKFIWKSKTRVIKYTDRKM